MQVAQLIAQGTQSQQRWRRDLPEEVPLELGRSTGVFSVLWDDHISRKHAELLWTGGKLLVKKLAEARNPIFHQGCESDAFELSPGEHFVIGQTTFTLVQQKVDISLDVKQPARQQSFSPQYLQQLQYRNARLRIDVLGRLPELISGASSQREMFVQLINLLMAGVPSASAVALVKLTENDNQSIEVLHWDRRSLSGDSFQPSERLIRDAIAQRESVLHIWEEASDSRFTVREDIDWAFCTPVLGESCAGWAIYVAGNFRHQQEPSPSGGPDDLQDDLKFTEVAAATLQSLQQMRILQKQQAGLSQFFSPLVLDALAGRDPNIVLAPREAEVSVLFCDLRGFSRESEKSAHDLMGLLDRVSKALGLTTHKILEQRGVVGDFQGDAVMGFWGWPFQQENNVERACRAALAIQKELQQAASRTDDALSGFQLGIGIATGNAVAGKIGTVDQVKVTVFGPVVNLASRLEGMTKILHSSILLDEKTAHQLRHEVKQEFARCRPLAKIRPYGMDNALEVSQLLPLEVEDAALSEKDLAEYDAAYQAFLAGDWATAFDHLHRVPAEDRAKDFLTVHIAQHNRLAPENWTGVIELESK